MLVLHFSFRYSMRAMYPGEDSDALILSTYHVDPFIFLAIMIMMNQLSV